MKYGPGIFYFSLSSLCIVRFCSLYYSKQKIEIKSPSPLANYIRRLIAKHDVVLIEDFGGAWLKKNPDEAFWGETPLVYLSYGLDHLDGAPDSPIRHDQSDRPTDNRKNKNSREALPWILRKAAQILTVPSAIDLAPRIRDWLKGDSFKALYHRPLQSVFVVGSLKFQDEFIRTGLVDAAHEVTLGESRSRDKDAFLAAEFQQIAHFTLNNALVTEWVTAKLF